MAKAGSKRVLNLLKEKASESPRPKQRLGTIERVVAACDAIESGEAAKVMKIELGKDYSLRYNPVISPSTIARYIDAKRKQEGPVWSGPKRPTIQNDADLKAYVDAREAERIKPTMPQKKTSQREQIEDVIDSIPRVTDRVLLREAFANLRAAKRENDELSKILKKIDPLNFDKLRDGLLEGNKATNPEGRPCTELLSEKDMVALKRVIDRLSDDDALSRFRLERSSGCIRHTKTGRVLIEKDELKCLSLLLPQDTGS